MQCSIKVTAEDRYRYTGITMLTAKNAFNIEIT